MINTSINPEDALYTFVQIAIQILLHGKKPILLMQLSPSNGESFVFSVGPPSLHGGVAI